MNLLINFSINDRCTAITFRRSYISRFKAYKPYMMIATQILCTSVVAYAPTLGVQTPENIVDIYSKAI